MFSVDLLIAHGAKVTAKNNEKATALHMAAEEGCEDCVQSLLAAGADIDAQTKTGDTPLLRAAVRGKIYELEMLFLNMPFEAYFSLHET